MTSGSGKSTIYLVGAGPGNPALLTFEARKALEQARCVIGAPRLLKSTADIIGEKVTCPLIKSEEIITCIETVQADGGGDVAVLLSGDPGFYSGAKNLIAAFREKSWPHQIVNGISSLVYFTGRLGIPWEDLHPVSLHGRSADVVGSVRDLKRVFFLTDGKHTASWICSLLTDAGMGSALVSIGENLSYDEERILTGAASALASDTFVTPNVVIVRAPDAEVEVVPAPGKDA